MIQGPSFRSFLLAAIAAAALFALPLQGADGETSVEGPRVVALGEVQCAANTVTSLLRSLDLIDEQNHWSGGDTILVQTGDLMDGGEHLRSTLDLFMRLQEEAAAAGGRVVVLMGNHEIMNIVGELGSVNYMTYGQFAGPDAESLQRQAFEDYVAWRQRRAKELDGPEFVADGDFEVEWMAAHPLGWVEYVESMLPDGVYGKWLRTLPVVVEIDDVLYVHGGISPEMNGTDIDAMNRKAAEEIAYFDNVRNAMVDEGLCLPTTSVRDMVDIVKDEVEYVNSLEASKRTTRNPRVVRAGQLDDLTGAGSWLVLDENGPLWFRGPSRWAEDEHRAEMAEILDSRGIKRMVTGQSDGKDHQICARFDNRVFLTSVNLSDEPWAGGGKPAALDIDNGVYSVVTLTGRQVLIDDSSAIASPQRQAALASGGTSF
jgi:hypothetical protein